MKGHRDLIAVTTMAGLCALVALIVPLEVVQIVAALPLCLLLPGYAIIAACGLAPLERARALLFSVGLSLTTLATGGLLLHFLPGGVRGESWAGLLFLVVLAGCAIAARRRPPPRRRDLPRLALRVRPIDGALMLGAVLCVNAAWTLSSTTLPAKNALGYTQLWMLPAEKSGQVGVRIGVTSAEAIPLAYKLEVRQQGGGPPAYSRLELKPGQQNVRFVAVRRPPPGGVRITARLYRGGRPGVVYRRVSGWVPGA
jgi:hypothetical protein